MKKNGFVSTSLIYTFFILFLLLMLFLLNSYSSTRFLMEQYKNDIKNSFAEASLADINLYILAWNEATQDYETVDKIPTIGYYYESDYSYCVNGGTISYNGSDIMVSATGRDSCYAYFRESDGDITLKIYTKETKDSDKKLVKNMPSVNYELTSASCDNNAEINFDDSNRKFRIKATEKTTCEAVFTKSDVDIVINVFKENAYGDHEYNGIKYVETKDKPGINYTFYDYYCFDKNINTTITVEDDELLIESSGKNECNVYYKGDTSKVELIIMMQTETGVSGYTTGLKYTKTASIPGSGYRYVGYICDNAYAVVTYNNGIFTTSATTQTTCRAYFNEYAGGIKVNYYLETSNGSYENVTQVPVIGYSYNKTKSKCINGSNINVSNNIVTIDATNDDTCDIYFNLATADINVQVYVMNRETNKYELSSVPTVGYELYNAGCTNGGSINYKNGILNVDSDGPTVCTVYFR